MTIQDMKQQKAKLEVAYYELLAGGRLSKGDIDGFGMAEFSMLCFSISFLLYRPCKLYVIS